MHSASPYPLIPVSLANLELVGLLLHPIPRSGTWRRLVFLQASDARPLARSLFRITYAWRTCRFGGYRTANRQHSYSTRSASFSQAGAKPPLDWNGSVFNNLRKEEAVSSAVDCTRNSKGKRLWCCARKPGPQGCNKVAKCCIDTVLKFYFGRNFGIDG